MILHTRASLFHKGVWLFYPRIRANASTISPRCSQTSLASRTTCTKTAAIQATWIFRERIWEPRARPDGSCSVVRI